MVVHRLGVSLNADTRLAGQSARRRTIDHEGCRARKVYT